MTGTDSGQLDLSIVVACRNEEGHIRAFLDSLAAQQLGALRWEAILADGRSTDGTREILEESCGHDTRIRWIDNPGRIVSTGLNAAIRKARGEFILRMDVHTEYAPDYALRSVEILQSSDADNVGGPARTRAVGLMARAIAAAYHSRFACGGARFHDENYAGYVDTVPYGCWRKQTLERLGLFDENLVRNQDDELNMRIVLAGGKILQSPKLVSWYVPRRNLGNLFRQYFQYGFWKVPIMRKHRAVASWRHLAPGAFVLLMVSLLVAAAAVWAAGFPELARWAAGAWLGIAGIYALACLGASLMTASRYGLDLALILPIVFPCYHISYGLGFLRGSIVSNPRRAAEAGPMYTEISR